MKFKVDLENNLRDSVKSLEIETDELDTKGVFLYYKSDNECFDTWHKTLEDAFLSAEEQYGVDKEDWIVL
ncbi:hypothetical protein QUH73_20575 [Labilibaculum sp. K2S]|uniref:hypothetical protein n=1 Tax=Labilibaculum sp. K2S TaxID=3056386 RepID=UPI0025A3C97C|nr:hypothetical protein [Labilibaculum sp. K2S]MDM8162221.1 hypothetical protein [Labilibaculum sp. K2S]